MIDPALISLIKHPPVQFMVQAGPQVRFETPVKLPGLAVVDASLLVSGNSQVSMSNVFSKMTISWLMDSFPFCVQKFRDLVVSGTEDRGKRGQHHSKPYVVVEAVRADVKARAAKEAFAIRICKIAVTLQSPLRWICE